ncbi:MAG: hypothetical protein KAH18_01920 [Psychromonas sp.]|nr:hypothetical protein [Psychromonas sp.]
MFQINKSINKCLIICIGCLAFGLLFETFRLDVVSDFNEDLTTSVIKLTNQNATLKRKKDQASMNDATQDAKIQSLVQSNKTLLETVTMLENKIYFYQRVISPNVIKTGIDLLSFDIKYNSKTGKWDYELVLTQAQKIRQIIKGTYNIRFTYFRGKNKILHIVNLKKLNHNTKSSFKFKYFKLISSSISVPKHIKMDSVIITLKVPKDSHNESQSVTRTFDWRTLVNKSTEINNDFD